MFIRADLERSFEDILSIPHEISVHTPLSFRARPVGLLTGDPGYSVVVERNAFKVRAQIVFDPLGGRIRTAILAGIASNPAMVDRTNSVVRNAGWRPELRISDYDLFIGAFADDTLYIEDESLLHACVSVAACLSDFVLSQLVVTRRLETRPASIRQVGEQAEDKPVWEYDPAERDRATLEHRLLENWLISRIREEGLYPLDPVRGPQFDLAWMLGDTMAICEVKTISGNEVKQLRLGLGQVLHYREQVALEAPGGVTAALLVGSAPQDEIWHNLCQQLGIVLFWPDDGPLPRQLRSHQ